MSEVEIGAVIIMFLFPFIMLGALTALVRVLFDSPIEDAVPAGEW